MPIYFVSSDTHGFFTEWQDALIAAGFDKDNENHHIILCGDVLDRGKEAMRFIDFISEMFEKGRIRIVKGNHESLFQTMVRKHFYGYHDVTNGTLDTLLQLQTDENEDPSEYNFYDLIRYYDKRWDDIMNRMENYIEIGDYIFVHGWIPISPSDDFYTNKFRPDWREANNIDWESARWYNGLELGLDGIIEEGKTIVCGHWHTSYAHTRVKYKGYSDRFYREKEFADDADFGIFYAPGMIGLDACTAHTKKVNVLKLELGE